MSLLELPSNREEEWRWSDLSALPAIAARGPIGGVPDSLPWIDLPGPRLLFVDGRLDESRSDPGTISFGGILHKVVEHPLAAQVGTRGWQLDVGEDHSGGPVQIIHVTSGSADHLLGEIRLADGAQASIVETYLGEGWTNRVTFARLEKGSRLMLNRRVMGQSGFVSSNDFAEIGQGASFVCVTLSSGQRDTRLEGLIGLRGEGAYAEVAGALLARGRQRHDVNLVLRHESPLGMSRQVWRSVADDRSACSVAARVEVSRGAQKTDAEQSLKGILLSRGATINAKPELEIFADDVKCAHGATVGELDRNALFYLESRGVAPDEAKALLTRAFVADALDRIGEAPVREIFYSDAEAWFLARAGGS